MRTLLELETLLEAEDAQTPLTPANYLAIGEEVMEHWVSAKEQTPTADKKEGFRLIALHRQGAKGEPKSLF